jgi:hypothetical protein
MEGYRFLKPMDENLIIRDPVNKMILSKNGEYKPWVGKEGTYWRRKVDDGSCIIIEQETEPVKNIKETEIKTDVRFDKKDNILDKKYKGGKE